MGPFIKQTIAYNITAKTFLYLDDLCVGGGGGVLVKLYSDKTFKSECAI